MIWAVHLRRKRRPVVSVEPSLNLKVFEIMEWIDWAAFLVTMTYVIGKIMEIKLIWKNSFLSNTFLQYCNFVTLNFYLSAVLEDVYMFLLEYRWKLPSILKLSILNQFTIITHHTTSTNLKVKYKFNFGLLMYSKRFEKLLYSIFW